VVFSCGRTTIDDKSEAPAEIVARNHPKGLEAEGQIGGREDESNQKAYSTHTYGPILLRSDSTPTPARSGSGGCWACSMRRRVAGPVVGRRRGEATGLGKAVQPELGPS
jgi:hypothetical protein